MKLRFFLWLFILLAIAILFCQPELVAQDASSVDHSGVHAVLPARLAKAIDSKKAKQGDEVVCKTTVLVRMADGTVLPTDTKIVGHITEAQAQSKGDAESALGMVFDTIQLAKGQERKISGKLQAIAPAPEVDTGGAAPGTIPSTYDAGTQPPVAAQANNLNLGKNKPLQLNPQSRGVVGFRDLQLGVDSVLTSTGKEIHLNSGTQMMLNVQFE
jgi:hypothetical protein